MNLKIYSSVELNENHKAEICPVCGNGSVVEGDYCQICGSHIRNYCTNEQCVGSEGLSGDARYCPHCGSTSTFAENKILPSWDENPIYEISEYGTVYTADGVPF